MPLDLDFLTQVINVHWEGGAIFVAGDLGGLVRSANLETDEAGHWNDLGTQDFTEFGAVYSSSYALIGEPGKPIFLLGGNNGSSAGIIMKSTNGTDWSTVHTYVNSGWAANKIASIIAIVWDEEANRFYAAGGGFMGNGGGISPGLPVGTQWYEDILFQSSDGISWTQVGKTMIEVHDFFSGKTFLITPYLHDKVKDHANQPVPDGVYGYYETDSKNVLIQPEDPPVVQYGDQFVAMAGDWSFANVPTHGVIVKTEETDKDGNKVKTTKNIDVGFPINGVAYGGGIWVAVGGDPTGGENHDKVGWSGQSMIARSDDDGKTWKRIYTGAPGTTYQITTVSGDASL